jgi:hypothetical protein
MKGNSRVKMKISRRTTLIFLLLALLLFLGILFRSFILEDFVKPVALMFWFMWRVLLSVDQNIYWALLILLAFFYTFLRLNRWTNAIEQAVVERTPPADSNTTLENVNYWRTSILFSKDEVAKSNFLKRDLVRMLVMMYASKQPGTANLEIYDALSLHKIPLPEYIYSFLFPAAPSGTRRTLKQIMQTIWQLPGKWMRRWTGRDVAEYYQSIEEVLIFMESSMEIKHDDEKFTPHHH